MSNQALVFLTHIKSERIFRHFERLREETKGLLSPLLCIHDPIQVPPIAKLARAIIQLPGKIRIPTPHLTIDVASGARLLPKRFAQMQRRGGWFNNGFSDLASMPAMLSEPLREYEYVWLLENDVDYAGNWRDFFLRTMGSSADLLSTLIDTRSQDPDWEHWSWFRTPPEVSYDHHISSLHSISRFSRRMLSLYVNSVQSDLWQGHTEALYSTIARHHGLMISDLGGTGVFCPEQWRGKNFYNPFVEGWNADKVTLTHGPNALSAYFHEEPTRFLQRDVLYHPVKAGWTRTPQARFQTARRYLRPLKTAMRGALSRRVPANTPSSPS
jgi:hypothetical protein